MHVIWKRPDGFHGADPTDFVAVNLGNHSKLWLHRRDHLNFPFRIAGGWQESEASARLNTLVNLLAQDDLTWTSTLTAMFHDQMGDDAGKFIDDLARWVGDLRSYLKGDTWEMDIMNQALSEVIDHINTVRAAIVQAAKA
jgi:hypothetical protein